MTGRWGRRPHGVAGERGASPPICLFNPDIVRYENQRTDGTCGTERPRAPKSPRIAKLITERHNNFATVIINAHIRETNMRFIRDRRDALASFAASLLIPALAQAAPGTDTTLDPAGAKNLRDLSR